MIDGGPVTAHSGQSKLNIPATLRHQQSPLMPDPIGRDLGRPVYTQPYVGFLDAFMSSAGHNQSYQATFADQML